MLAPLATLTLVVGLTLVGVLQTHQSLSLVSLEDLQLLGELTLGHFDVVADDAKRLLELLDLCKSVDLNDTVSLEID